MQKYKYGTLKMAPLKTCTCKKKSFQIPELMLTGIICKMSLNSVKYNYAIFNYIIYLFVHAILLKSLSSALNRIFMTGTLSGLEATMKIPL